MGNGVVTCASIYSSDFHGDYGDGPGAAIWIDNLGTNFSFIIHTLLFCQIYIILIKVYLIVTQLP